MKQSTRTISLLYMLSCAGMLCGLGCSSSNTGPLTEAPSALRPSYTDQSSRILAEHTLAQLSQQDQDYKLGAGDVIEVNIFEWELSEKGKTVPVRVSQMGMISLPMIGDMQASGKTVWDLKKQIEQRLQEGGFIRRPQVSVIIKEFHSKKIAVVGSVANPGVYVIERNVTSLLDVLSLAGGLSEQAGQMLYVIRRKAPNTEAADDASAAVKPSTITIDLHELTEEHMSLHLSSPYQITKMLGELYCNFFKHHHDVPIVETRFFNSYGPGEIPGQYRNVIPNFIYWAMCGKPLVITGTGEETRDFCWVHDIADGLLRAGYFEKAIGQAMNLASEHETSIAELAQLVNKHIGNEAGITYGQKRKWDTKSRLLACVDRARDLLGYEPSMDFEDGLQITIDWFRSNWDNIQATARFGPGVSSATREVCAQAPSLDLETSGASI